MIAVVDKLNKYLELFLRFYNAF